MIRKPTPLTRRRFLAGSGGLAAAYFIPGAAFAQQKGGKLNIYNFDTYIGDNTIDNFTAATGITVRYDTYANNEELFAKLKTRNPGYDIIVPSDYMIQKMIAAKKLLPIDKRKIPNLANIDPSFLDPKYDPGSKFSIPYMWGTVGLGYRTPAIKGTPDSWSQIFGPEADALKGSIVMLDEQRIMIGAALKYLGFSLNSTNPVEIAQACDLLIRAKKNITSFAPDSAQDLPLAGDANMVVEWNGDIVQVMKQDPTLSYSLPKEGGMRFTDCLCIPVGAPNPDSALAWINFVNDPKVNAGIANTICYATPNLAARKLINPGDLKNPDIYPSEAALAKWESHIDLGSKVAKLYDDAWTKIRAA
ncbi:MAG: spermidine/putrescine ABC transporter substrate-binding protein [Alphaproteobacteria bacterium]|nr:spermidine/putrescine ABC transporter substrate-binding protein [Alphaproteobacteria bacterium]